MDLISEIRDPENIHSGSRIQGSKRHRVRIRNIALGYEFDNRWNIFICKLSESHIYCSTYNVKTDS
jgi:hypothetical protein